MIGKVYLPFVGGLGLMAMGAVNLLSHGPGWFGIAQLVLGFAAVALALYYWRDSHTQGS